MSPVYPVIYKISAHCLPGGNSDPLAVQSEIARKALQLSARIADLPLGPIRKDDKGAPFLLNGVHLSLSHTPIFATGVAACSPIGIDLEEIVPFSDFLKNRVATESEWQAEHHLFQNHIASVARSGGMGRSIWHCQL